MSNDYHTDWLLVNLWQLCFDGVFIHWEMTTWDWILYSLVIERMCLEEWNHKSFTYLLIFLWFLPHVPRVYNWWKPWIYPLCIFQNVCWLCKAYFFDDSSFVSKEVLSKWKGVQNRNSHFYDHFFSCLVISPHLTPPLFIFSYYFSSLCTQFHVCVDF